jgi:DNA-binding NarL/FixJ family response regulator
VTDAEREVADLVEDGLRNAEIAERLFVSRRTVETHVSRLYKKLGADNRVALAASIRAASEPARS